MKRLLVLLIVLAGGVAWAAFSVPSNAATVNGGSISQHDLNSDVSAIAGSAYYQCYLNSQDVPVVEREPSSCRRSSARARASTPGTTRRPPPGSSPTTSRPRSATSSSLQVAAEHHVTVTQAELATARANLTEEITSVMSEILQTQQGQNVRYGCSVTGQAADRDEVLATMPSSFVDEQVQFVATATALQEDLAGVGSSDGDLQAYFDAHSAEFDTACLTAAVFSSQSAAQDGGGPGRLRAPRSPRWRRTPASSGAGRRAATSWPTW